MLANVGGKIGRVTHLIWLGLRSILHRASALPGCYWSICCSTIPPHRQEAYLGFLTDQRVAPDEINIAGWELLLRNYRLSENAADVSHEALIKDLERNELALTLLRESPVSLVAAERLLTAVRRWLLLSKQWQHYPKLMTALQVQASLNGGAWPFDDVERARLAEERCNSVNTVYFPVRTTGKNLSTPAADDPITSAVAMQYEGWPYPAWTRVTVGKATHLPAVIGAIDNESREMLPIEANMLIAGCGTGRQAAAIALDYPDATITAIDLSQASLDYAQRQYAALGIVNVRFIKLDLHDVAALNQRFHAIHCTGVLHHLPDPERGLKILADVLHPGGVMRIMVYNRHRRLMMNGARAFVISDLLKEPICDDLLRQVRRRFLEQPKNPAAAYVMCSTFRRWPVPTIFFYIDTKTRLTSNASKMLSLMLDYACCRSICHRLPLRHATMLCFPMILSIAILNHGRASS